MISLNDESDNFDWSDGICGEFELIMTHCKLYSFNTQMNKKCKHLRYDSFFNAKDKHFPFSDFFLFYPE